MAQLQAAEIDACDLHWEMGRRSVVRKLRLAQEGDVGNPAAARGPLGGHLQ